MSNEHVDAIKRIASTFREGGFLSPADEMCRHADTLARQLAEAEARCQRLRAWANADHAYGMALLDLCDTNHPDYPVELDNAAADAHRVCREAGDLPDTDYTTREHPPGPPDMPVVPWRPKEHA